MSLTVFREALVSNKILLISLDLRNGFLLFLHSVIHSFNSGSNGPMTVKTKDRMDKETATDQ